MKKIISIAMMALASCLYVNAQDNGKVIEPEFIGQVLLVNADSTTVLLKKEEAKIKAKSSKWGMIPIPGAGLLDKMKSNLIVKGTESPTKLKSGRLTFVVRAEKNDLDPKEVFGVAKFEVKKKTREYLMMEAGALSGVETTTNFTNVEANVRKFGKHSYIVVIEDAKPGQYAIITNISNVVTFGVE